MSEGSKRSSVSTISGSVARMEAEPVGEKKKGLGMWMTSFFLIAQMAGAGFLSLPKALANTGWLGVPMLILFCTMVGFSGTRLGKCWVILEERYPEYKKPCRQPYMEIADKALGVHGRRLTLASVVITLLGGTTVFLILIASFLNGLIPQLSSCEWLLIVAAVILPFTWLGTPKDFWQASVLAVISTAVACIVIFIQILVEIENHEDPFYQNPTISTFALGFGAILFAFGGASVFPTIQNDMGDRTQFGKSVVVGFAAILSLYLPVAVAGYAVQGFEVGDNILLSVNQASWSVTAAIILEVINLFGTYIISFNPVGQVFEELLGVENKFGYKRCLVRSAIIIFEVIIGLAVPDFGMILNLIGGSTVTVCSFILPPLMYMKLVDRTGPPEWPKRTIPLWERVVLWEIIIIGAVGGITSTVSAFIAILDPDSFNKSCFVAFS
ncbi:amino acid transporter AVT1B-like isoform X1 [Penaeus chinensis]|uniref:amino acid transporter AVT1B-like isoform X1 n=1 Tax=Penaeus chinensis TaxID=139456 RepID=UPI001FB84E4C|nr:amino acid transporter AVT1B-like isoform X1 [Penaeus chinensis]